MGMWAWAWYTHTQYCMRTTSLSEAARHLSPSSLTDNFSTNTSVETVVKSPLRTTKPSTRTLVSSSPATKVKSSMRTATTSLARAFEKHGHVLPTLPPVLGVLHLLI